MQQHDFRPTETLEQRLAQRSKSLRDQAELLPPGAVRDATISKAQEVETGTQISQWLLSPGLRPSR